MPNLFPQIYPSLWEYEPLAFQLRDFSKAGGLQINSYDPVIQVLPPDGARAEWTTLTRAQYDQIEDHWWTNRTSTFSLFHFHLRKLRGLFIGVADGAATIYTLPAKGVVTPSIKHNNIVAATQPALLVGGGADGQDRIQYTSGTKPVAGTVLTLDAADGYQFFEEVNYGSASFDGKHREADIWTARASFIQKVVV